MRVSSIRQSAWFIPTRFDVQIVGSLPYSHVRRDRPSLLVVAVAVLLSSCATSPCGLFGSADAAVNQQCAIERFGATAPLWSLNEDAKRAVTCAGHLARIQAQRPDAEPLYTMVHGMPHVSAVVDGYVLDNGALGIPGDIMALDEFMVWWKR